MWSSRCEIGWPTFTLTPGKPGEPLLARRPRRRVRAGPLGSTPQPCRPGTARSSARTRHPASAAGAPPAGPRARRVDALGVLVVLGPARCAGRPTRPRAPRASSASTRRRPGSLSRRLVPGSACTLTVSVPSLNGGRNSPPIPPRASFDSPASTTTAASTGQGWRSAQRTTLLRATSARGAAAGRAAPPGTALAAAAAARPAPASPSATRPARPAATPGRPGPAGRTSAPPGPTARTAAAPPGRR